MTGIVQDVRYALRQFRKNPGFAAVAISTLALGVGANTAIFGLVDSAFLHSLPFRDPERLVHIWTIESNGEQHTPTLPQYQAVRDGTSFEQIAAAGWADYFYDSDSSIAQTLAGRVVTPNWLPTLGVKPWLGRNFREEEQFAGEDAVVMLSYNCWQTRFHADSHILGKQTVLNHRTVTVVGIMPPSLGPYYGGIEIFAPLVLDSYASQGYLRAGKPRVEIVARLRAGAALEQARSEADVIAARLRSPGTAADRSDRLVVENFGEEIRHPGPTRANAEHGLVMTAAAAGFVLLIACANVASLLMAHAVGRRREVAVRAALGSSQLRIVRQFLIESAVLFVSGGIIALLVTRWCQAIISKTASGLLPGVYLRVDARVFGITVGVSFLTALAFGAIPALQATHLNLNENLKDAVLSVAGGTSSRRLRNGFVAGQVALGMVLLVGFGLLLRSFLHVESSRLGYDPHNVVTASLRLPVARYAAPSDRVRLMRAAAERVRSMPGVESVSIADSLPMQGAESALMRVKGPAPGATSIEDEIYFVSVSPAYFSALKVPILSGRSFAQTDDLQASPVVIVNRTFAKHYFAGANPVGAYVALADSPGTWREIVGVVSDFRQRNPEEDLRPMAYFPVAQTAPARWSMAVRIRAADDAAIVLSGIRDWLRPVDPQLYWELGTMQLQIHDSESLTLRRPMIALLACFGTLAIVLVVVGVFGVTAYSVAERTREMGIRVALGAARGEIARLVLRESLVVASLAWRSGPSAHLGQCAFSRLEASAGADREFFCMECLERTR